MYRQIDTCGGHKPTCDGNFGRPFRCALQYRLLHCLHVSNVALLLRPKYCPTHTSHQPTISITTNCCRLFLIFQHKIVIINIHPLYFVFVLDCFMCFFAYFINFGYYHMLYLVFFMCLFGGLYFNTFNFLICLFVFLCLSCFVIFIQPFYYDFYFIFVLGLSVTSQV